MEKQNVYTPPQAKTLGAFQEDALCEADALEASTEQLSDLSFESKADEIMAGLIGSMKVLATSEGRRQEVAKLLV